MKQDKKNNIEEVQTLMENLKTPNKKLWWGWLIWIPISIALGLWGTTKQGGEWNINQLVYVLLLPIIFIVNAVRQKRGKKTHFWVIILILLVSLFMLGPLLV